MMLEPLEGHTVINYSFQMYPQNFLSVSVATTSGS